MHCANKDFSKLCILPPYNNYYAHVIKRGTATSMPEVVTTGYTVEYSVPGNTYSVGKTNFWDFEDALFGVALPDNTGLAGKGLAGDMDIAENHFVAEGIPLTPYTDDNLTTEDPYQMALLQVYDGQNNLLATTENVIPVSNEINCVSSGCHSSETNILYEHEEEGGFDPNATPILCAECHGSNALGIPGTPGLGSLSYVIHSQHAEETNDCYKCHPGPNTQCLRGVMHANGLVCQDCHGSVHNVAQSISNGREPWLEEPQCGATECHGANYAEEPGKLFRQSHGHAGLYCSTCHGSPHAVLPSTLDRDNQQNIALQGSAGVLNHCTVCHEYEPIGTGPHGLPWTNIEVVDGNMPTASKLTGNFPNPFSGKTNISFQLAGAGKTRIDLLDANSRPVKLLLNQRMPAGNFTISLSAGDLSNGIYFCKMQSGDQSSVIKLVVSH